jgi:transcription elongation factor GreA
MVQKYVTQEGYDKQKAELENCKLNKRRIIAQAIKEAKEQGDLSENAEYTEAKRQQRENEGRIMKLENIIRTAEIIKDDGSTDSVKIGCVVDVENGSNKNTFHIVGASEADPANGLISNESPLGEAILGKKKGEEAEMILPNGKTIAYKILSIGR